MIFFFSWRDFLHANFARGVSLSLYRDVSSLALSSSTQVWWRWLRREKKREPDAGVIKVKKHAYVEEKEEEILLLSPLWRRLLALSLSLSGATFKLQ